MTSAEDLAEAVNVDLAMSGSFSPRHVEGQNVPDDAITAVHRILNPNSERTLPELYYRET